MRRFALALGLVLALAAPALAVNPDEMLGDPVLEARARHISADLRCLVCQNQSIDDSDASLARDLRIIVRERLVAGDSDAQVKQYLVDRYGEFVLLNPVVGPHTVLLWSAAPAMLAIGIVAVWLAARRRRRAAVATEAPPTEAELAALRELEESGR
ncbi:cytochrome c-type biogenesis protein [Devosia sp.]|uniref:cytochrome c-type biogenesis protein n=1 Tax=Devosia sp. TaxID=1871048 RepID=UPI002EEE13BB